MKKLALLSAFAISLLSTSSFAQETKAEHIFKTYKFSIFLGPTFNSLKPTAELVDNYKVTKVKGNVGFSFGLNADYNLNERYTLYTGIGLDSRGGTINAVHDATALTDTSYVYSANVKYGMKYLTIPFGLKMKAAQFDKIKIFAQTGVDLGLLLSQKGDVTYKVRDTSASTITKEKVKLGGLATVVPINFGWTIGVGAEYELNENNSFYATLLYRNGIIDATAPKTNDKGAKFSDGNIRSNTIAFRIGYYF